MSSILGNDTKLQIFTELKNPEPAIASRGFSFNTVGAIGDTYNYFMKLWNADKSRKYTIKTKSD